ncbi:GNAT family N-acetyltransferase [Dyadobacter sandarakinus]|uniref:GNAT family N-acetyltransferase n=1 Tax=Dyadobacter sandarakinus TaxID=2747268 RepID=A0ABX7IBC0_9BACT|nr:GNAT family N-acetyltransferase [Dyadobacter sandarakinus]QRR03275.1 GNAT family N-acetyltransferase [Dyadobacter sandarakinus]
MTDNLTFIRRYGAQIEAVAEEVGKLRIAVFRDFPYLYEGSLDYEKEYLTIYSQSEHAFLFAVYDGTEMVGATTCIPLADESDEVRKPFEDAGMDVNSIFYFGESILLQEYRGRGLGHLFFDEREAHARSFGSYELSCFCAVERGENHPQQPADYRPNDAFWLKRGYRKEPAMMATMEWPDLGETASTPKQMIFWLKSLTDALTR